MATSGSQSICVSRSGYTDDYLVLTWKRNSYDSANSTNNITVSLQIYSTAGIPAYNLVGNTVRLRVGGNSSTYNKVNDTNASIDFRSTSQANPKTIATWTGNVNADANGNYTLNCYGYINYTDDTSSHMKGGEHNVSITNVAIDQIPRASVPSISPSTVNFGDTITITTNRKVSTYTHKITLSMTGNSKSHSKTLSDVGASTTYQIPDTWADTIPSATSNTLTLTCKTYSGSTQIGSTQTITKTVNVPSSWKPTVTVAKTASVPDASGNPVKDASTMTLTATASASAGTSITSYSWSGDDVTGSPTTASVTTSKVTVTTQRSASVTVTDARGRTKTVTATYTAVSGVSSFTCDTSVDFGSAHTVRITPKNSGISHTISRAFGNTTLSDSLNAGVTTQSRTIPTANANECPDANSIQMTVTVTSKYGSTTLGSASKTATINVPGIWTPSLSTPTASVSDKYGTIPLKLKSKATISATNGVASTGATIVSYTFSGNALNTTVTTSNTSASATSGAFTETGNLVYTVTLVDSRGRSIAKTVTVNGVENYSKPTIKLSAHRCDSGGTADDNGDYCKATMTGSYDSSITGNKWKIVLKYRVKGSSGAYTTLDSGWQTGTVSYQPAVFAADVNYAYEMTATITDDVGLSATKNMVLSTAKTVIGFYKDNFVTIGKPAASGLLTQLGSPTSAFYTGMAKNYLDGETYIPASGTDGLTNGWQKVDVGIWNRFYTTTISSSSSKTFQLDKLYKGLLVLNGARTQQRGLYLISNSSSLSATVVTVFAASDFSVTGSTNGTLTIANNYSSAAGYIMFISSYGTVS